MNERSTVGSKAGGALLASLLVAGTFLPGCKQQSDNTAAASSSVGLPDLHVETDGIDKVSITNGDKGEVVLELKSGTWEVTKPVAAPANQSSVKQLLDNMKELKVKEVITSAATADQKREFEFGADQAVHVVAFKGADKKLDITFGKAGARGQVVMVDGNAGIHTVSGYSSYVYARDPMQWAAAALDPAAIRRREAVAGLSFGTMKPLNPFDPDQVEMVRTTCSKQRKPPLWLRCDKVGRKEAAAPEECVFLAEAFGCVQAEDNTPRLFCCPATTPHTVE